MRDFRLRKPVAVICGFSLVFAALIFVMTFRLDYYRQASQYTNIAAVSAEKMNLSLEKTQIIVETIAWSNQLRLQDMESVKWNIRRMHGLYPILHTIYVSNAQGRVLLATADKIGVDEVLYVDDRSYFDAAQQGYTAITGPFIPRGRNNNTYALIVSSPYYLDNGDFGGVVAAAVNLKTLEEILSVNNQYDNKSMIALISPARGSLFTIGGALSEREKQAVLQEISAGPNADEVKQIALYTRTFSLAPLSTSTPLWVAVVGKSPVIWGVVLRNLGLALLAGLVMAVVFISMFDANRRQRQKEMAKKRQMAFIGEMAATIAHEIRNPLTYIKGKLSLEQELGKEDNDLLLEEVERIEAIVEDILIAARPIPLILQEVMLAEIVEDSIRIMGPSAQEKGVTIKTFIPANYDIIITADRVQLRHVFVNLLKNAIEATPRTGLIKVTVEYTREAAWISVEDTGEGMTEKELKQFGKLFYTTKKGGTGLGISTCYRVVHAHQGEIQVTSAKGMGTLVKVCLPLIKY